MFLIGFVTGYKGEKKTGGSNPVAVLNFDVVDSSGSISCAFFGQYAKKFKDAVKVNFKSFDSLCVCVCVFKDN